MTDYADLTLAEAATPIRQKAISPVESRLGKLLPSKRRTAKIH